MKAQPGGMKKSAVETLKSLGFALVAVIILNSFVVASFQVPTPSMENTVMTGDFLFVNKFIYGGTTPPTIPLLGILFGTEIEIPYFRTPGFRDPEQGDVIVFIFPGYRNETKARDFQFYLKRCVAVAGDTLQVIDKQVYVNGKKYDDPEGVMYVDNNIHPAGIEEDGGIFPEGKPWNRDNYGPIRIPKEGDVLPLSVDNIKEWAVFIRREGHDVELRGYDILIDGKKASSYKVERDYVFGMGDNRDNSLDSRFWGFIPYEYVIGTPMMVYWSMDPSINNIFKKIRFDRMFTIIG
ncbi:MAG TPA: signal peptidase I [Bacteroidota bacterium]|nr:signal peptidase I [Bacteroidota bacterium]